MCRSRKHGYCYLPGGHIEFGEPATIALRRELVEEAALECAVGPLLLTEEQVFNQRGKNRHELTLIFEISSLANGQPLPEKIESLEDHIEFVWLDVASVPDTVVYPESTKAWLASGGELEEGSGAFLSASAAHH